MSAQLVVFGQKGVNQNYDKNIIYLPRQYMQESNGRIYYEKISGH